MMMFDKPVCHPDMGVHTVYHVEKSDATGRNHLMVGESMGQREGTRAFPEDAVMFSFAPPFGMALKRYMRTCTTHIGHIRVELAKTALRGEIDGEGRVTFGGKNVEDVDRGGVHRDYLEQAHPEILATLSDGQDIARKIADVLKPTVTEGLKGGHTEVFSTNHNHCTCRAGVSAENSVVNSDLESHDVDGLFVADASTIPFQCAANPGMPTAAICSYGWRRIVAKHFTRI
jgi:choline dehydrogenase-like flavoprotein